MNSGQLGLMPCSTHLLNDPMRLREQFLREGYVFCRGIVPVAKLLGLRRRIAEICYREGWIKGGTQLDEMIAARAPINEGEPEYFDVYDQIQKCEEFHALPHDEGVLRLMQALLGDSAFPHPLGIARLMFPSNAEWATPPHQDYPNNQGTQDLYACWIPLGDCPVDLGGIAVLEKSHHDGVLPLRFALGPGGRQAVLDPNLAPHRWLTADFEAGDVLVFHSLTVHRALENRSAGRMRISCDFRFQRQGEELVERSLRLHFDRFGWESIYADWKSKELQYYWRNLDYRIVPWDESFHKLPEEHMREAVRLQRAYDKRRNPTTRN